MKEQDEYKDISKTVELHSFRNIIKLNLSLLTLSAVNTINPLIGLVCAISVWPISGFLLDQMLERKLKKQLQNDLRQINQNSDSPDHPELINQTIDTHCKYELLKFLFKIKNLNTSYIDLINNYLSKSRSELTRLYSNNFMPFNLEREISDNLILFAKSCLSADFSLSDLLNYMQKTYRLPTAEQRLDLLAHLCPVFKEKEYNLIIRKIAELSEEDELFDWDGIALEVDLTPPVESVHQFCNFLKSLSTGKINITTLSNKVANMPGSVNEHILDTIEEITKKINTQDNSSEQVNPSATNLNASPTPLTSLLAKNNDPSKNNVQIDNYMPPKWQELNLLYQSVYLQVKSLAANGDIERLELRKFEVDTKRLMPKIVQLTQQVSLINQEYEKQELIAAIDSLIDQTNEVLQKKQKEISNLVKKDIKSHSIYLKAKL